MYRPDPRFLFAFLLHDVAWLMRRDFHAHAHEMNMTQVQARALANIARNEGIVQAALAQRLEIQPMTLGRLTDRMEKSGLVQRRRDTKDRRAIGLYLTRAAGPALKKIRALAGDMRERSLRGFRAVDEDQLIALLERMKRNLTNLVAPKRARKRKSV
ncbi:MAG: MarR family transcriptional regulator [Rhodospirillaceae bacterium]|nr:MarR family transcriptional regulator [Rhodospirillaceae bacterium]